MEKPSDKEYLIAGVRFHPGGKVYHFDATNCEDLVRGDYVVVDTVRGRQIGQVAYIRTGAEDEVAGLKPILHRATGRDLALHRQWQERAKEALLTARQIARTMGLDVKLSTAEYTIDGRQLTLLYVTGTKEQLQQLQDELARKLRVKVELRQIGPRDHARLVGGYGACGEPRCCARFLSDFVPISIRMGKTQGISLTPSEITGMCGRLRCCLAYEYEMYAEASKDLPKRKARVRTPYGVGKIVDLLPLRNTVVVQIDDTRIEVPADEVEVIPNDS